MKKIIILLLVMFNGMSYCTQKNDSVSANDKNAEFDEKSAQELLSIIAGENEIIISDEISKFDIFLKTLTLTLADKLGKKEEYIKKIEAIKDKNFDEQHHEFYEMIINLSQFISEAEKRKIGSVVLSHALAMSKEISNFGVFIKTLVLTLADILGKKEEYIKKIIAMKDKNFDEQNNEFYEMITALSKDIAEAEKEKIGSIILRHVFAVSIELKKKNMNPECVIM